MFHLQLITLSGHHVDQEVFEIMVPTTAGIIAINKDHAPLLAAVAPGVLSIRHNKNDRDSDREEVGVYTGTIEVLNNTVRVLADEVDVPDEIVQEEAEKAFQRAQELKEKAGDAVSLAEAQAMMDRQAVRLKLADLKRHRAKRR